MAVSGLGSMVTGAWQAYTRAALMSDPLGCAALLSMERAVEKAAVVEVPLLVVGACPTGLTTSPAAVRHGWAGCALLDTGAVSDPQGR